MIEIIGNEGISAKVVADSINADGNRLTTFELDYPRFCHSEFMTHRMISKNAASSRAIPVKTMIENIHANPAMPVFWGKNQAGMQATQELSPEDIYKAKELWLVAKDNCLRMTERLVEVGLHKQIANRVAEFAQRIKVVASGTEWANLLWLRDHDAAQPEFHELASCIRKALEQSTPKLLKAGEWHLPYVTDTNLDLETAKKVSASCCAQVSYRKLDDSIDKAVDIYNKLVGMDRAHSSPFEHQGTPMAERTPWAQWESGITHIDRKGQHWSANYRGWIQQRQLIPNHVVW